MAPITHTKSRKRRIAKLLVVGIVALAALTVSTGAALASAPTDAVNVDHDGYYDAIIREKGQAPTYAPLLSSLTTNDVGAKCAENWSVYQPNIIQATLTIRPPKVWPLSGLSLSSENVAWRAEFVDPSTNMVVQSGSWVGVTAGKSGTEFGGSDLSPSLYSIYNNNYLSGGESMNHQFNKATTYQHIVPWVQVGWLQPNGTWVFGQMRVNWVLTTSPGYQGSSNYYGNC